MIDGGGPESIEPVEPSVESGEVDDGKGSSAFMRVTELPLCAGPGIGSEKSEEKLCALEGSDENPDDSGCDEYRVGVAAA